MNTNHFELAILGLLILVLSACQTPHSVNCTSPLESKSFTETTSHNELIDFVLKCDSASPFIQTSLYALNDSLSIPVVELRKNDGLNNKLNVMFMAQQHGNEPSGKEGLLLLISYLCQDNQNQLLDSLNIILIPQCNPFGAEHDTRRNGENIDMNRDHLLLRTKENQIIHAVFEKYLPEMTVDFHEYYPFGDDWIEFGYRKNIDIQLGGLTNINIDPALRNYFYENTFPFVKQKIEAAGFSFFEYTLGNFATGERLRHSTVDVNDGRQSFGIAGTYSMIVEGINGRDSNDELERRSKSQFLTALSLLENAAANKTALQHLVSLARKGIAQSNDSIAIRMEHIDNGSQLYYPLLSLKSGKDTVFVVDDYHPKVVATLSVLPPSGYLIPAGDSLLVAWLKRSNFSFAGGYLGDGNIFEYRILLKTETTAEGIPSILPVVEKQQITSQLNPSDYYFVPTNQLYKQKIITALEPQSMYGLASYQQFSYLINQSHFPILRVE